jgi:hypothetical protein
VTYRRLRADKLASGGWTVRALGIDFPSLGLAMAAIDRLIDGASRR